MSKVEAMVSNQTICEENDCVGCNDYVPDVRRDSLLYHIESIACNKEGCGTARDPLLCPETSCQASTHVPISNLYMKPGELPSCIAPDHSQGSPKVSSNCELSGTISPPTYEAEAKHATFHGKSEERKEHNRVASRRCRQRRREKEKGMAEEIECLMRQIKALKSENSALRSQLQLQKSSVSVATSNHLPGVSSNSQQAANGISIQEQTQAQTQTLEQTDTNRIGIAVGAGVMNVNPNTLPYSCTFPHATTATATANAEVQQLLESTHNNGHKHQHSLAHNHPSHSYLTMPQIPVTACSGFNTNDMYAPVQPMTETWLNPHTHTHTPFSSLSTLPSTVIHGSHHHHLIDLRMLCNAGAEHIFPQQTSAQQPQQPQQTLTSSQFLPLQMPSQMCVNDNNANQLTLHNIPQLDVKL